jgi:outer membrane immunogenic protein
MKNKSFLIATLGGSLLAGAAVLPALAEDAAPSWGGFQVGLNAGYGFGETTGDYLTIDDPVTPYVCFGPGPTCPTTPDLLNRLGGAVGGVQAAYLIQRGQFIFGAEASLQLSAMTAVDNGFLAVGVGDPDARVDYGLDYYGTIAARIGMAFDRVQVFATGGAAYGKGTIDLAVPAAFYAASQDYTSGGWTAGAGFDVAVTDKVSIGARFDYVSLNQADRVFTDVPSVPLPVTVAAGANFSTLRTTVNFKF